MLKFALKQVTCVFPEHKGKIHHLHPVFVWENNYPRCIIILFFPLNKAFLLEEIPAVERLPC